MVAALLCHWVATHLYLLTSWAGLAALTIIIARWQWERVERLIKARIIREMERKAGVPISIEALTVRPIKGELGLTNLIVRGSEGKWQHAYFMKVHQLTCKAHGGLLGCASLAGMPESELSFPQLIGHFVGHKLPGTQKQALSALNIVREAQPGIDSRLATVPEIAKGLAAAAASSDAAVASGAQEIIAAFKAAK